MRQRTRQLGWIWLAAFAAVLASATAVSAQSAGLTVQLAGVTADDPSQAQAVVSVVDAEGGPVAGLTQEAFQVALNDAAVPVTAVARAVDGSLAIDVVLAIDTSGSMQEGGALDQAKAASRHFLDGLALQDRVAVVTFADAVNIVLPFTRDRAAAAAAIDGLQPSGATALYQATVESLRLAAAAENARRAVVLLSDGVDNGSPATRDDAIATAQTLGVPVFSIGLGTEIDRAYLQELARDSGGQFAETPSAGGLGQLFQGVGQLLRGQYVLTLDASGLQLDLSKPATVAVTATSAGASGRAVRDVCLQRICVSLTALEDGVRLKEPTVISAQVVAAEPVTSVVFSVDGEAVQTVKQPPYQYTFEPASFAKGKHTLSVEATTASGSAQATEVSVRVGASAGGLGGSPVKVFAGFVLVLVVAAAVVFILFRRRRGGGESVRNPWPQTPLVPAKEEATPRAPLWEEGPFLPLPGPTEALGRIVATGGPLAGQSFAIGSIPSGIGTGHRCQVRVPEDVDGHEIRTEHARVWIRDGQLMLHELRRLTAHGPEGGGWEILQPGDGFTLGSSTFVFELVEDEPPEPPPPAEPVPNVLRDRPANGVDADMTPEPAPGVRREQPANGLDADAAPQLVPDILRDKSPKEAPEPATPSASTAGDGLGLMFGAPPASAAQAEDNQSAQPL